MERGVASRRSGFVVAAGAALALAAAGGRAPGVPGAGPFSFQDLSAVSGGPVDFGTPASDVEKATGAFVDVDGDGWDDVITLTGSGQPFGYFLNRPDGSGGRTFVPAPPDNGLDTGGAFERDGASITAGDVDGDGDEDLYVGCGWNPLIASGENLLLLNDGPGRFTDATASAGLLDGDNTTCACVLFDMDLDGDLDLLSVNTDFPQAGKYGDGKAHLFRNELRETGVLHFTDEIASRGIVEVGTAVWAATAQDVEGDGDADVLISHDIVGPTQLYRNDGTGHFTEVTAASGGGTGDDGTPSTFGDDSRNAMGVDAADYDNDGDLDLFITDVGTNALYQNNGDGTFRERSWTAGVRAVAVGWGCNFEDFDLDGLLDLYVAEGNTWGGTNDSLRSDCYRNLGDGTFEEVWASSGFRRDPPLHREIGTACSDFDRDGRVDLLVVRAERAGASPYLYRNLSDTQGRRWIGLRLRGNGTTSNTSAIGARIRAWPRDASGTVIPGLVQLRELHGSVGRASRSGLTQVVGLGADAVAVDVEVTWPRAGDLAGRSNLYVGLPLDSTATLTDDVPPFARLPVAGDVAVPAGRATEAGVPGAAAPGAPGSLALESGPAWCSAVGDAGGGWSVLVVPPAIRAEASFPVVLLAGEPGVPGTASRESLAVRVIPVPAVEGVTAARTGRALKVSGHNFRREATTVLVDGVPAAKVAVRKRVREEDRGGTLLAVRLPRAAALPPGAHEVVVRDDATGYASDPFLFDVVP